MTLTSTLLAEDADRDSSPTVLIVDPNRVAGSGTAQALDRAGFCAVDSAGQHELHEAPTPSAVVLWLGLERLWGLRQLTHWKEVPIVCVAPPDQPGARLLAFELGANDVLSGPIDSQELVAHVKVHVRTARRIAELSAHAHLDELTGVLNRRGLMLQLRKALAQCARRAEPCSLVLIDLDGFKQINDRLGHDVGDRVLRAAGEALTASARCEDSVGRLGGDEFVLVLPRADAAGAAVVAERVRHKLAGCNVAGLSGIESSMGAVTLDARKATVEDLLAHADIQMYAQKRSRRAARPIIHAVTELESSQGDGR